nr:VOC family protein [Gymnodinialimonas phycosphaerae]
MLPHLMFQGQLDAALTHWQGAFPDMVVTRTDGGDGPVTQANVVIAGQAISVFDSPPVHDFTFTPSISLMVCCDTRREVDAIAAHLGDGGEVLMPLDAYDFSARFTWLNDRFGVSWQIMVAP